MSRAPGTGAGHQCAFSQELSLAGKALRQAGAVYQFRRAALQTASPRCTTSRQSSEKQPRCSHWPGVSRVLRAASAAAWRLPLSGSRASLRAAGVWPGLICGIALIAILVNRVREDLGLGVAGLTFVPALVIYGLAWLGVSMMLPRATDDPGALLPGSLLVALTITVIHAISEFYLLDRLDRASRLYGAIGTTIVTLGWFFILGRGVVLAMELNAAIYERYGSISQVVFSLPFFRVLARKSARVRWFFGLR